MIGGCLFRIEGSQGKVRQSTLCEEGKCAVAVREGSNEVLGKDYFDVD
jgi:hypothetical protein